MVVAGWSIPLSRGLQREADNFSMKNRRNKRQWIQVRSRADAVVRLGTWPLVWGLVLLAGCAPTLDWREQRVAGTDVVSLFPCRPSSQSRTVILADEPVSMTLYVCSAGQGTYALTSTVVGDPARVPLVLRALRRSAAENLGARPTDALSSWMVPGMTPSPEVGQWRLAGHLPDGSPVEAAVALAVHGTRVVQVSVTARSLRPADIEPFLEAVRFAH